MTAARNTVMNFNRSEYLLRGTFADPEPITIRINVCYSRPLLNGIEWEKVNFGDVSACLTENR